MAFVRLAIALVLLQLSLLLCCSFTTVYGDAALANEHYPPPPPAETPHPSPLHHHKHHHYEHAHSPNHHYDHHAHSPNHHYDHHAHSPNHHHHHHRHQHHHSPTPAPIPQTVMPVVHLDVKPSSYLHSRKMVAIQGVVFCKSCKYRGIDTLLGAAPLAEAVVKLECNNTKSGDGFVEETKTDKNGYFFLMPHKLSMRASHMCKVLLVSSPEATCTVPTNLHDGAYGALLIPSDKTPAKAMLPFDLFSVGPFAFEANKQMPCHY